MKRLLMATAAVIALAIAAPLATAQYTTPPPATAPYTTPATPDDPNTPQDESMRGSPDTTMTEPAPPPTTPDTMPPPTTAETQTGVDTTTQAQTTADDTYADTGMGANVATTASLDQHARDAGMDGLPMSPQEVCLPRDFQLTTGDRTSLSRDREHQLINAADRASVCDIQQVVIHSPTGRADEARQLLIDSDVDPSLIEVQEADMGGLHVQMNFAGIATSSEQYAAMFNPQQLASYQPSTAAQPYGATPGSTQQPYQPSTAAPDTSPAMPDDGVYLGDPNVEVPADPTTDSMDGMSPTAGEPVVQPGMLDI